MIQALITINNPNYSPTNWQGTLLVFAMALVLYLANTVAARGMPLAQNILLVFHCLAFFTIIIVLWVMAPKNSATVVFTQFTNGGNWSSIGVSLMVGQISAIYGSAGSLTKPSRSALEHTC